MCRKDIVAAFDGDVPFPVYCNECWWSDKWDPLKYGQDYDFNRAFFPQFQELLNKVPKVGQLQLSNENTEYSNYTAYSKNTYMCAGSFKMEDCYYARKSRDCKDCMDSNFIDSCELVSSSINCFKCYNSDNLANCRNCTDCSYISDSISCESCFMCSGISNKKYNFKNKQLSQEDYENVLKEYQNRTPEEKSREFQEFNKTVPKRYQNQLNCEKSSGDYIQNCKNATECYDSFDIEDSKHVIESYDLKDSMDVSCFDKNNELCYEVSSGGESNYNLKFSFCSCASPESTYLYSCFFLSDSFGCDGIHFKNKNCILNKKYSAEEYTKLKDKIIEHMKSTGEWGEYFPIQLSLYPYNHTLAQDYHPLTGDEARKKGYKWADKDQKFYQPATINLPDRIKDIPDSITKEILACQECGRNYRITKQELELHRKIKAPISVYCPDCRQVKLLAQKNPRKLFDRKCDKCGVAIKTTYAPDRPETVYCEKCYLDTVY